MELEWGGEGHLDEVVSIHNEQANHRVSIHKIHVAIQKKKFEVNSLVLVFLGSCSYIRMWI